MGENGRKSRLSRRAFFAAGASIGAGVAIGAPRPGEAQPAASSAAPLADRGEFLVRGAHLLTMDPKLGDFERGDVHIVEGRIAAVGPSLKAPGATVINGENKIAMPGLIETHWHMWGTLARNMAGDDPSTGYFPISRILGEIFQPEDNARGVRLALAESLNGGITTVHNWSHNLLAPNYADAELQAHKDFGGRALFSYGYSRRTQQNQTLPLQDVARVHREWIPRLDGLVTLGVASRGPENNTIDICEKEFNFARGLGLRITCHIGTSRLAFEKKQGVKALARSNLLGPDLLLVHNTWTDSEDLAAIARTGTYLSFSPFTELRTGFGITPILASLAAGAKVSLSVDTPILCGNSDMFAIMKAMQNIGDGTKPSEFALPARRVLQMATIEGAEALGLGSVTGSLTPGKRADLILLRTRDLNMAPMSDPVRMAVQAAQPSNVDTVIVDGRLRKKDGRLVGVDVERIVDDAADTMRRVKAEVARRGLSAKDVQKQLPFK